MEFGVDDDRRLTNSGVPRYGVLLSGRKPDLGRMRRALEGAGSEVVACVSGSLCCREEAERACKFTRHIPGAPRIRHPEIVSPDILKVLLCVPREDVIRH